MTLYAFGLNKILFIIRYIYAYIKIIQLTIGSDGKHSRLSPDYSFAQNRM